MNRGWSDEEMARRVIADLWVGAYINVGLGLPLLINELLPPDMEVIVHSENGILGTGPAPPPKLRDEDLINPAKEYITIRTGASFFDSATSFAMLRGGHVDVGILGAYQVSERGDLANWKLPGQPVAGVGGAADISVGVKQLWVMMKHRTRQGESRIVRACSYPLTARAVVKRIYTDMAVIRLTPEGLRLAHVAPGYDAVDVIAATNAPLES